LTLHQLPGGVLLPDDLLLAQDSDRLVVFGGAGVSAPPPSNLPLFRRLVEQIGTAHGRTPSDLSNLDLILDDWAAQDLPIHRTTQRILSDSASRPCSLHFDLLGLFRRPDAIRLVTTNFDLHFVRAATESGIATLPIHRAPALPPGNRFSGLVFLHAALDQCPEDLVLTRRDFGRAYLTEGWARRFMLGIFSDPSTKVLFVGYSFADVIMQYLMRGIPPTRSAFALTDNADAPLWRGLGITPVQYARTPDHGALREAVADWANQTRMGTLGHRQRIVQIVSGKPPVRPCPDASYLDHALHDEAKTRFFVAHARGTEWLEYLAKLPVFETLFDTRAIPSRATREFVPWLCRLLQLAPVRVLRFLLERRDIHPDVWAALVATTVRDLRPPLRAQALVLLLQRAPTHPGQASVALAELYQDYPSFRLLLELLTQPRLVPRRSVVQGKADRLLVDATLTGEDYWLLRVADGIGAMLPQHAEDLASLATSRLEQAHTLLATAKCASQVFDPLSFLRQRIARRGAHAHGWDAVIDIARTALEVVVAGPAPTAELWIERLRMAASPLLRRLALHLLQQLGSRRPTSVLEHLIACDGWYTTALKTELFEVVRCILPALSVTEKDRLLERVLTSTEEGRKIDDYERYNFLVWLTLNDPYSGFGDALTRASAAHPEFQPRTDPELNWSMSGLQGAEDRPTAEQIGQMTFEELLAWTSDESTTLGIWTFRESVQSRVAKHPAWALDTIKALRARAAWASPLWDTLLLGLQRVMTPDLWRELLTEIASHPQPEDLATGFSYLLLATEESENESLRVPDALLSHAEDEALRVLIALPDPPQAPNPDSEWLMEAINHPAGRIAEFLLRTVSRRWVAAKDTWSGLPSEVKQRFDMVVSGASRAAALARVVLVSQLHFFLDADQGWSLEQLLPRLDWRLDPEEAARVWHGFLAWGRWTDRGLASLLPLYRECAAHVRHLPIRNQDRYTEHLASLLMFAGIDPFAAGWLPGIVATMPTALRCNLARHSFFALLDDALEDDQRKLRYDQWIRRYLDERVRGIPCLLDASEASELALWSLVSAELLEAIAPLLRFFPRAAPGGGAFTPMPWLKTSAPVLRAHPSATAQFLLYFLRAVPRIDAYSAGRIERLLDGLWEHIPELERNSLQDELARVGYPSVVRSEPTGS